MDHRVKPGGDEEGADEEKGDEGSAVGNGLRFLQKPYWLGPSWQDCGAVGESRCQVGTSHFEQAASERPSASDETMARKGRTRSSTRRWPLPRNFVRILSTPYAPYYSEMARDCDLLAAPARSGAPRRRLSIILCFD
jgi:hypothetical protein